VIFPVLFVEMVRIEFGRPGYFWYLVHNVHFTRLVD
jgi:hypothetical protein